MARALRTSSQRTIGQHIHIKQDVKKQVQDRFEMASDALSTRHESWRKIRNAYHGYVHDVSKRKGRANFHLHKVFPQIELEAARFITSYFRHDPFISVNPTSGDDVEKAQAHERVLQHYLEHAPTFFREKVRLIKYAGLYGNGFEMPSWRKQIAKVKRELPFTYDGQQVGATEIETEEVVYEGLWFKTFSPMEIYPYPFGSNLDTIPWLIVLEFVLIDDLMSRANMGIYDRAKVLKVPLNAYYQDEWDFTQQMRELGHSLPSEDPELICLQHMFTPDRFVTLANDDVIIRDTENIFVHGKIPLVQGVKTIDPDGFWAVGSAKNMLANQKLVNLFINSMADLAVSSIWPVWKYRSNVNPNDLLSLPNQRIGVRNMDDVDIIRMPEMKQDLLAIKAMIENNIEETTGYYSPQKGYGEKAHTATAESIFQSEGNQRISSDIMTFEELTLLPESRMVSKLVQQFMPEDAQVRLQGAAGPVFQKMNPEEIRGEFDLKASGSSEALNRAVVQQQLIELFNTAQNTTQYVQMPGGAIIPVPVLDTYNALKELYEGYNRRNTDKLLYRPEVFGIPLSNDLLNQYGLPSVPGLDQLQVNPRTGSRRNEQGAAALQNMGRSVKPEQIINRANRQTPTGVGVM